MNIIKDFETINPYKKYKSDLEVFIRESKLEDFFNENGETIFVSTIHDVADRNDLYNEELDEHGESVTVGIYEF